MLGVVEHVLETGDQFLRGLDEPQILATVEVEIPVDEAVKIVALFQTDGIGRIAEPAVKFGTDPVKVFRFGSLFALANLGRVLAAQPGLEAVRLDFLARVVEFADAVAPAGVGGGARVFGDVGEQVALKHVRWAEG